MWLRNGKTARDTDLVVAIVTDLSDLSWRVVSGTGEERRGEERRGKERSGGKMIERPPK
jgi:hypothetical protein